VGVLEPLPELGSDAVVIVLGPVIADVAMERVAVEAEK
jgi:hypothetical protein